jgi:hypothetical protein
MDFRFLSYTASPKRYYCVKRSTDGSSKTRFHDHFVMTVGPGNPNTITWYVDGQFNKIKTNAGLFEGDVQVADLWQVIEKVITLLFYLSL